VYTLCLKKVFDNNFGKCGPIRKVSCIHHKDFHLTWNMLLHYLVKVEITNTDFDSVLNKLLTCS